MMDSEVVVTQTSQQGFIGLSCTTSSWHSAVQVGNTRESWRIGSAQHSAIQVGNTRESWRIPSPTHAIGEGNAGDSGSSRASSSSSSNRSSNPFGSEENSKQAPKKVIFDSGFTDFLYRKRAKTVFKRGQDHDAYILELVTKGEEKEHKGRDNHDEAGYCPEIMQAVLRDQLAQNLHNTLEPLQRLPYDREKCRDVLVQSVRSVMKTLREAHCLKHEVKSWGVRMKIKEACSGAQVKHIETVDERKQRLKGFWVRFHSKPHKRQDNKQAEVPLISLDTQAGSIKGSIARKSIIAGHMKGFSKEVSIPEEICVVPEKYQNEEVQDSQDLARSGRRTRKLTKPSKANSKILYPPLGENDLWRQRSCQSLSRLDEDRPLARFQSLPQLHQQPVAQSTRGQPLGQSIRVSKRYNGGMTQSVMLEGSISEKWKKAKSAIRNIDPGLSQPIRKCVSLPTLHTPKSSKKLTVDSKRLVASSLSPCCLMSKRLGDQATCCCLMSPEKTLSQRRERQIDTSLLPVIVNPKSMPWQTEGGQQHANKLPIKTPTEVYLHACTELGVIPCQMPFVSGHSAKFLASDKGLSDHDLLPIVTMMASMKRIDEVALSGNVLLTEKSLVPLLNGFFRSPATTSLQALKLKQCLRLSSRSAVQNTMDIVVQLLNEDDGLRSLDTIDLSGIPMSMFCHVSLCKAMREHSFLRVAHLSDIGLSGQAAITCIDELTNSSTLECLDLSWNCFSKEVFFHLGERVANDRILIDLNLANCSGSCNSGIDNPIQFLLEQLHSASSLTSLDISMNRIDFRGCLVLEDALEMNKSLVELDISNNPLGVLGLRSVLRLLSREESGLLHFNCKDCTSCLEDVKKSNLQTFNATNPGGRYRLDLHRPYHRALLRMFYKMSEHFSVPPGIAFKDLQYSGKQYQHPPKDSNGVWSVLQEGRLTVTFNIESAFFKGEADPRDFAAFLERYFSKVKTAPGFHKLVPLMAEWAEVAGQSDEQLALLDALARDFRFTYPQLKQLCTNRSMESDVVTRLLPCLVGGKGALYLSLNLLPYVSDHLMLLRKHRNFMTFNVQNPTGRYHLDLDNCGDYDVAQQLMLLDLWEKSIAMNMKLPDTSQRGNWSRVRNECFQDAPIIVYSLAEWILPESGLLQLDYASGKTPPPRSVVLSDSAFSKLMMGLQQTEVDAHSQLESLREVSHHCFVSCLQARELLGIYSSEAIRSDLFVMLFSRVTDIHNEKLIRVRFDRRDAIHEIRNRLGFLNYFPFIQPEQTWFELDLAKADQQIALNMIMKLLGKESYDNLKPFSYTHEDGKVDPLPLGMPRVWEYMDKMPSEGIVRGMYNCAPEDRSYKLRKELLEHHTAWRAPEQDNEVQWWAVLTETPEDVMEFLEFLVGNPAFKDVWQAFDFIDKQMNKDGSISFQEFKAAIPKMNCKKFDGEDRDKRIETIFRYLDPSGGGSVSKDEWSIMSLLFQEMQLSIKEFVQFLSRAYGDDLGDAWNALDDDGSGEIDVDEWEEAVNGVGFFGPSHAIFSFMDKDDGGSISVEEFRDLEEYKNKMSKEERRRSLCMAHT